MDLIELDYLGKCQGLTIIPYSAGHTLGGTIWKIRSPSSGTILYAVDLNHTRERHLDGTVLLRHTSGDIGIFEPLARPDLLITDAERALVLSSRRKDRDSFFLGKWMATARFHLVWFNSYHLYIPRCHNIDFAHQLIAYPMRHFNPSP